MSSLSSYLSSVIDFEKFDRKHILTEGVTLASFGWACYRDPYTVLSSIAVGAALAHVVRNHATPLDQNSIFRNYKARVIARDGGSYDEMICLTITSLATVSLKSLPAAILSGLNAGQLAYRDFSRLLFGRNRPES